MKPILFNTEMVRAILEDRKTCTRRLVKDARGNTPEHYGRKYFYKLDKNLNGREGPYAGFYEDSDIFYMEGKKCIDAIYFKEKYQVGDILYVKEMFTYQFGIYWFKAGPFPKNVIEPEKWKPSIHMPKDAARIFLKVTDVRVEKLQDITEEQAIVEGTKDKQDFMRIWESTVKKFEIDKYGWDANPWVWVYEFERCEKPKEGK